MSLMPRPTRAPDPIAALPPEAVVLESAFARLRPAAIFLISILIPVAPLLAARPRVYAIQGARIVVAPDRVIEQGTVVVRDGTIAAVGNAVVAPPDAETIEGKGLTVYAGLIDPFTHLGMPKGREEGRGQGQDPAQPRERAKVSEKPAERGPGRQNLQIRSDARADLLYQAPSAAELERLRGLGFTSALVVPDAGVFRGTSALVHLAGEDPSRAILASDVAAHLAFETVSGDIYPASLMGVMALSRQAFLDARRQALWEERWRKNPRGLERPPQSPTLNAIEAILNGKRVFCEADDTHAFDRIVALAKEFSISPVVVGSGFEYEIAEQVKRSGYPLIVPVAFPEAPHLDDEDAALDVRMKDLRRWDRAPANLAALQKAGIQFALTTYRLRSVSDFPKNVRKAIESGLSPEAALAALTVMPARLLGVEALLGTVETGKIADLVLTDGDLFGEKTKVKKLFVDGEPIEVEAESKDFDPNAKVDPRGTWELTYSFRGESVVRTWRIGGSPGAYAGTGETQAGKVELSGLSLTGNKLTGTYTAGPSGAVEFVWIIKGEELTGSATLPNGMKISFSGKRVTKPEGGAL